MSAIHWQKLGPYFKLAYFRFFLSWFALAPVAVKLLEGIPNPLPITILNHTHIVEVTMPFNWTILWFGSLFYLAAFVIYTLRCPAFIKQFPAFAAFKAEEHSPRYLVHKIEEAFRQKNRREQFIKRMSTKGYVEKSLPQRYDTLNIASVEAEGTVYRFQYQGEYYHILIKEDLNNDRMRDLFWEIFEVFCSKNVFARLSISALLLLSLSMVCWVLWQQVYFVLAYFAETDLFKIGVPWL